MNLCHHHSPTDLLLHSVVKVNYLQNSSTLQELHSNPSQKIVKTDCEIALDLLYKRPAFKIFNGKLKNCRPSSDLLGDS